MDSCISNRKQSIVSSDDEVSDGDYESDCEENMNTNDEESLKANKHYTHHKRGVRENKEHFISSSSSSSSSSDEVAYVATPPTNITFHHDVNSKRRKISILSDIEYDQVKKLKLIVSEGIRRYEEYIDSDVELDSELVFKNKVEGIDSDFVSDSVENSMKATKEKVPDSNEDVFVECFNTRKDTETQSKENINTMKTDYGNQGNQTHKQDADQTSIKEIEIDHHSREDILTSFCGPIVEEIIEQPVMERQVEDAPVTFDLKELVEVEDEVMSESDTSATSAKDSSANDQQQQFKRNKNVSDERKQRRRQRAVLRRQESESQEFQELLKETVQLTSLKSIGDLTSKNISLKEEKKSVKYIGINKYILTHPKKASPTIPDSDLVPPTKPGDNLVSPTIPDDDLVSPTNPDGDIVFLLHRKVPTKPDDHDVQQVSKVLVTNEIDITPKDISSTVEQNVEEKNDSLNNGKSVVHAEQTNMKNCRMTEEDQDNIHKDTSNMYENFQKLKKSNDNFDIALQMESIVSGIDIAIAHHGGSSKDFACNTTNSSWNKDQNIDNHVKGILSTIDNFINQEEEEFTRSFEAIKKSQQQMKKDREFDQTNPSTYSNKGARDEEEKYESFSPYKLIRHRKEMSKEIAFKDSFLHNVDQYQNRAEIVENTYCIIEVDGTFNEVVKWEETNKRKKVKKNTFVNHAVSEGNNSLQASWKEENVSMTSQPPTEHVTKRLHVRRNKTILRIVLTKVKDSNVTEPKVLSPKQRILQKHKALIKKEHEIEKSPSPNTFDDTFVNIDASDILPKATTESSRQHDAMKVSYRNNDDKVVLNAFDKQVNIINNTVDSYNSGSTNQDLVFDVSKTNNEVTKSERYANKHGYTKTNAMTEESHINNVQINKNQLIDSLGKSESNYLSSQSHQKIMGNKTNSDVLIKNPDNNQTLSTGFKQLTPILQDSTNKSNETDIKTVELTKAKSDFEDAVNPVCIANTECLCTQLDSDLFNRSSIITPTVDLENTGNTNHINSQSYYSEAKKTSLLRSTERILQEKHYGNNCLISQQNDDTDKEKQREKEETIINSTISDHKESSDNLIKKNILTISSIVGVVTGEEINLKQYLQERQQTVFHVMQTDSSPTMEEAGQTELIIKPVSIDGTNKDDVIKLKGMVSSIGEVSQHSEGKTDPTQDIIAIIHDDESDKTSVSNEVNIILPRSPSPKKRTISFLFKDDQDKRYNSTFNINEIHQQPSSPTSPRNVSLLSVDDSDISKSYYSTNKGGEYLTVASIPDALASHTKTKQWQYKVRKTSESTCQISIQVIMDSNVLERFETETFEYKYLLKNTQSDGCVGEWVLVNCTTQEIEMFINLLKELVESESLKEMDKQGGKLCLIL